MQMLTRVFFAGSIYTLAVGFAFGQEARMAPVTQGTFAFVNQAAIGDSFEIEAGRLAQSKAARADVRHFAAQMVTAHSQTSDQLKALAGSDSRLHLETSGPLDASRRSLLMQLRAAKGTAFDKLYIRQQIEAHRNAVTLFSDYAQSGEDEPLKQFAARTLPTLQQHLAMAQKVSAAE